MKIVIVGGVAGGATAAARIRRNTEQAEIILLEKGAYISYANCGLPYYIGGIIEDRERLFVQTPEAFAKRFNIDVRVHSEVIAINPDQKLVTVRVLNGGTYQESYDKLLLSPGASPVRPPLKGIDTAGIFTLRNVDDTDRIKQYLSEKEVKRAVIVGGGFIGLEMAENLVHAGVKVFVVEMANQVMGPIDYSMAALVHEHLQQKGVTLYLSQAVEAFEKTDSGLAVVSSVVLPTGPVEILYSVGRLPLPVCLLPAVAFAGTVVPSLSVLLSVLARAFPLPTHPVLVWLPPLRLIQQFHPHRKFRLHHNRSGCPSRRQIPKQHLAC